MALELRQQMKLSQQLVMTPQLQQAIKLLQLSRVELLETVQQEMLENPFLEESYTDESLDQAPSEQRDSLENEAYDRELARDASWEDYLGEFASTPKASQSREMETAEELSPLESRCASKPTLEGHLLWQLRLSTMTDRQKEIGEVIIGNLSSSGYLQASVEEVAEMAGATPEETAAVLEKVQLMDPVGVAARDVRECLMVQIKNLNYDRDPVLVELVQSHLEDLEAKRYKPVLRKFKLDMEDLHRRFLKYLEEGDTILDLGCGSGRDSLAFYELGYDVTPLDASEEMCKLAEIHTGIEVLQMAYEDMEFDEVFDGIWGCGALIHVPEKELKGILERLIDAMCQKGVLFLSFKEGDFEGFRGEQYICEYTEEKLERILRETGRLEIKKLWTGDNESRNSEERWVNILARKIS